jgi:hypothetical protein
VFKVYTAASQSKVCFKIALPMVFIFVAFCVKNQKIEVIGEAIFACSAI